MEFTHRLIDAGEQSDDDGGKEVYLPLAINVRGLRCLIVGGGRIAARKVGNLVRAGATVTVLAPEMDATLTDEADKGNIRLIKGKYEAGVMADYDFIVAATSDADLNLAIGGQAEAEGKLCCVVSSARHSRVIFPASFEHDGITYALHSNGTQYRRTKQLRDELAAQVRKDDAKPE